ncbi:MAG: NADH-quinone oxidoreductase subunit L [Bdellovibrionaceae bacterium]|nr:NADH-quinone oxidoreductase subunit L [Pseudobdellovibrionaceae bacterium]MDW8189374.1 NADH-quinone oxidoreductase subunit L [Pseudobdellovibrionaceae bacterium]
MSSELLFSLLIFAPLVGFAFNGLLGKKLGGHLYPGVIASVASFISFVASVGLFQLVSEQPEQAKYLVIHAFDWMQVGTFRLPVQFLIDPLSSIMILVITGVGTLIHIFSIGYMAEDPGIAKYFSYLNFFLFNMLILVTGDSLPLLFVGWEGVGLCSYLLIGFWYEDHEKAEAGMKAFIVNRVGDAAFLLGMFVLYSHFGTLNLLELNSLAPKEAIWNWLDPITIGTLLLFVGVTGKSAQVPLYVWLPDAMAGPTPVSALIHAATMVTAGVYMMVRLSYLYTAAPYTMIVVAAIGLLTAVLAATMGIVQWDIKKVLAYSTVSQLGYMVFACGVGAFSAAFFHLVTHAFFKALMFLGAGSVIYGMHHQQDIREMGGLNKRMPLTYWTFMIGWLSIIGLPPFSGFFSKDEIKWFALASDRGGNWIFWGLAWVGSLLTTFYMTRLMAYTFWRDKKYSADHQPHESPWVMTVPLMILAFLAATGGFLGIPHAIAQILPGHPNHWLEHWLKPVISLPTIKQGITVEYEWLLMGLSVVGSFTVAMVTRYLYLNRIDLIDRTRERFEVIHKVWVHKYYVDAFYQKYFVENLVLSSRDLWRYVDVGVIDRLVNKIADVTKELGRGFAWLQSGNMQNYAFITIIGLIIFVLFLFKG